MTNLSVEQTKAIDHNSVNNKEQHTVHKPLMLEMSMLSWVSFSHVRSMHSYTDCKISLGSSSTHLRSYRQKIMFGYFCALQY